MVSQLVMPQYRAEFLRALAAEPDCPQFIVGVEHFEPGSHDQVDSPIVSHMARNIFLLGRRLVYQRGTIGPLTRASVAVLELNPRILNNWIVLILRRIMRRTTYAWGHAFPRRGAGRGSDRLRSVLRRIASGVILYTEAERSALSGRLRSSQLWVAPNALYPGAWLQRPAHDPAYAVSTTRHWSARTEQAAGTCARSLPLALDRLPDDVVLTVVGDGPLADKIRALCKLSTSSGARRDTRRGRRVRKHRSELFSETIATVATGYVGLNAVQSLGFGVPILYPSEGQHSPEVSPPRRRDNSRPYAPTAADLASGLEATCLARADWLTRRPELMASLARRPHG